MNRLILSIALFFAFLCGGKAGEPLIVGMEMSYPPFEMTDTAGNPAGLSVDLAKALGKSLNRPVIFENIPFQGLIPALKTGKVHCVISSMTATPERARSIDFSDPYFKTGLAMLVGKDSNIQSWADLDQPGRKVVVKLGTTGHLYANAHVKNAKVLVLDKETACALEVAQGKADAFVYDQLSIFSHWQENEGTTRPLLQPLREEEWAVGIRKGDTALRDQVNRFLKEFRASGGFNELGDRWLSEQKEAFRKLGIPFLLLSDK